MYNPGCSGETTDASSRITNLSRPAAGRVFVEHRNLVVQRVKTVHAAGIAMADSQPAVADRICRIAGDPPAPALDTEAGQHLAQNGDIVHKAEFDLIEIGKRENLGSWR